MDARTLQRGRAEVAGTLRRVELRYLYLGTSDTERDLAAWLALPGARMRWRFRRFGADVAGVDLGDSPMVILAELALLRVDRPGAMDGAYVDPSNPHVVGPPG